MSNNPKLILNGLFMQDFMKSKVSSFGLGYVKEGGMKKGFLALKLTEEVPKNSTQQGFNFGHSVLELNGNPIFHFAFRFYDFKTYNGLVIPSNPIIKKVIKTMIETKDYFFFLITSDNNVTAFCSELDNQIFSNFQINLEKYQDSKCTEEDYEKAVEAYKQDPDPFGDVLEWVCRDNLDYLNLEKYPLELNPK